MSRQPARVDPLVSSAFPRPPHQESFAREFARVQEQLTAKLGAARERFKHAGDKGTSAEDAFRTVLREYLPRSLEVGHGEVLDTHGRRSAQTDCVVTSADHPLTFSQDLPGLFFIEGVVAAGQVKSILTADGLSQAVVDSRRFKELAPVILDHSFAVSNPADLARFYNRRPWFLFAYESQLTVETISDRLEAETQGNPEDVSLLDAVFVLDRGLVINLGNGEGAFKFLSDTGGVERGWVYGTESMLLVMMAWLSIVMPRLHSSAAILPLYLLHHVFVPKGGASGR